MKKIIFLLLLFLPFNIKAKEYCNSYEFKFLFLKIYDINFCSTNKINYSELYQNDFYLKIIYARDIEKNELIDTTIAEIEKNIERKLSAIEQENYRKILAQNFVSVKVGDTIKASYLSKQGKVEFFYNEKFVNQFTDKNFAKLFFDIWLGQKATYQDMRNKLLL